MDEKTYKRYKKMIAEAEAKVDNKPPKFKLSTYYKTANLKIDANRVKEIDRENMTLLRRMNIINRIGGNIDCWLPKINYESKFIDQERINNHIMRDNKALLKTIRDADSHYSVAEFIKNWKIMKIKTMHGRRKNITSELTNYLTFHLKILSWYAHECATNIGVPQVNADHCMASDSSVFKNMNPSIRTHCFFEIQIQTDKQVLGRIKFELYDDIVPKTCANFAELCNGTTNGLSYKNTPFHRIVSGYWCQGGDVTKFNGCGGTSIYGDSFENENYNLRHNGPGVLSMCNDDVDRSNSKFNLTFRRLETVDKKHVVFGKVVSGISNIYKIEEFGTKTGKPIKTIIVSDCGVIPRK